MLRPEPESSLEDLDLVGLGIVEEGLAIDRVGQCPDKFVDAMLPEHLGSRPVALGVEHRHLRHELLEEVEGTGYRGRGDVLLELRVAVTAELLCAPQRSVQFLPDIGRVAIGDEEMAVGRERGFPVAGLLGCLRRCAEL